MAIPVITIIGKSKSGKTTLMEALIHGIKQHGFRVGTVKHHSHAGFDIDKPGKDSWRHAHAGSDHVVIAAPDKLASYRTLDKELSLAEVAAGIADVNIILVEGYKRANMPAIEVVRKERGVELIGDPDTCLAIATDTPLDTALPQFDLNDAPGIVDFVVKGLLSS